MKLSRRHQGKGTWSRVADTVFFQPQKTERLAIWRGIYKLKRQLREAERSICQNPLQTWQGTLKWKIQSAWHELMDETKAMLTSLLIHLLTMAMIVVFNALWFAALFWLIGVWLDG